MDMKSILYRGGVLTFRIPACWEEEYSDMDGGMFYENRRDSGTLRVKVITMAAPPQLGEVSATQILAPLLSHLGKSAQDIQQIGENALVRYQQAALEDGVGLTIFYWVFGNPILPQHGRIVTFSYTVLTQQANSPEVERELAMLEVEIMETAFSAELGCLDSSS
jgi:hypothetical protein